LRKCDAAVAIFDGIEIESCVAFEIGFAYCLGNPIVEKDSL
jgi:nucleoside 2-deoxyribosyltransferase